jgi:alanine dehydrogenase
MCIDINYHLQGKVKMKIGVPKEIKPQEYRVGATPAMVRTLVDAGHEVMIENDAGKAIGYTNEGFISAGARIVSTAEEVYEAEMVIKVKEPQAAEYPLLKKGQILFCYLHLAPDPIQTESLLKQGVVGVAYETVTDDRGKLPLLEPMSEIAGRISIQVGAMALQMNKGGKGVLMGGVPGVLPAKVLIIGGGAAGTEAARMAFGLGSDVTILDTDLQRLRHLDALFGHKLKTLYSSTLALEDLLKTADLVVGAVLLHGKKAPKLITRDNLKVMTPGSVLVDIAIDQGGCFETSRPTTHDDPTYIEEGIVHYCVTNMPGACAKTSTEALTHATMKSALTIANKGVKVALEEDEHLRNGLNVCLGEVTCKPVAIDLGYNYCLPERMLQEI